MLHRSTDAYKQAYNEDLHRALNSDEYSSAMDSLSSASSSMSDSGSYSQSASSLSDNIQSNNAKMDRLNHQLGLKFNPPTNNKEREHVHQDLRNVAIYRSPTSKMLRKDRKAVTKSPNEAMSDLADMALRYPKLRKNIENTLLAHGISYQTMFSKSPTKIRWMIDFNHTGHVHPINKAGARSAYDDVNANYHFEASKDLTQKLAGQKHYPYRKLNDKIVKQDRFNDKLQKSDVLDSHQIKGKNLNKAIKNGLSHGLTHKASDRSIDKNGRKLNISKPHMFGNTPNTNKSALKRSISQFKHSHGMQR